MFQDDFYQPMIFQGEEMSIGIRGWTIGYDYYAFERVSLSEKLRQSLKPRAEIPLITCAVIHPTNFFLCRVYAFIIMPRV